MLSVNGEIAIGNLDLGDGRSFSLRPSDGGLLLVEVVTGLLVDEVTSFPDTFELQSDASTPDIASDVIEFYSDFLPEDADDGSVVSVMVLYTPNGESEVGDPAAMVALVDGMAAYTNTAYENSGIVHRIEIVGVIKIDGDLPADATTLDALRAVNVDADPFGRVSDLRNELAADLVVVMLPGWTDGDALGRAYRCSGLSSGDRLCGFSVVRLSTASGRTFAHELGHNLGAAHDLAHADSPPGRPYAFGWCADGAFTTIMAGCLSNRIPYFSNPNILYGGVPTGSSLADNARALNESAFFIANFRPSGNQPPVINAPEVLTLTEGSAVLYSPSWSDPDGIEPAVWTARPGSSWPKGLMLTKETGQLVGTLSTTSAGDYLVRLRVTDYAGMYGEADFHISVLPLRCRDRERTLVGTPFGDILVGTEGPDVIIGLDGSDTIYGLGGDDVVCGGSHADTIYGGDGKDALYGNDGADTIFGQDKSDRIYGGDGDDFLYGNAGTRDRLFGGRGTDSIDGGSGRDDRCTLGSSYIQCEVIY